MNAPADAGLKGMHAWPWHYYFTYSLRVIIGVRPAFCALVNSSNVQYVCKIGKWKQR